MPGGGGGAGDGHQDEGAGDDRAEDGHGLDDRREERDGQGPLRVIRHQSDGIVDP